MNIKQVQILAEAVSDLDVGKQFYNKQEKGVGEYFWDSLISDIESLVIYAGVHSKVNSFYRMTSKRFPYSIYYSVRNETASVVAVLPERRNPHWLKEKLSSNNRLACT